jgi:outer membrane protein W
MFFRCDLRGAVAVVAATGLLVTSTEFAMAKEPTPANSVTATNPAQDESAEGRQRNWRMRIIGAVGGDNGGVVVVPGHPYAGVSVGGTGGVGVNFEYRTSPRMGFELGAMALGGNVRTGVASGYYHHYVGVSVDGYVPITFALNYHPLEKSEIVDLYVGPLAASTFFSSVGVGSGTNIESRIDFGLGANAGVDINFSKRSRWSFNAGLKYISNISRGRSWGYWDDFDPLLFTFGIGFKF